MTVAIRRTEFNRWGSTIPYRIAQNVTTPMKQMIQGAINDYEKFSQLRFIKTDVAAGAISFMRNDFVVGCGNSYVGYSSQGLTINLKRDCDKGTVLHEVGHALGLFHEHQHPNRDDFVTYHQDNVDTQNYLNVLGNFRLKDRNECVTYGGYDYGSIMHYPKDAFAKPGTITLETSQFIGQRIGLSLKDWDIVKHLIPSNVHIHNINGDGPIGSEVTRYNWSEGWNIAKFYKVGSTDYLFLLKTRDGVVHIHKMNVDGTVGELIQKRNWWSGWTVAEFFSNGFNTYLFLIKTSTGAMKIRRVNNDGTIGQETDEGNWSKGWSSASYYSILGTDYLLFLKRSNGIIHIHKTQDGKIKELVSKHELPGSNWQIATHFNQNLRIDNRMFFLRRDGKARTQQITWDGKLGSVIGSYNWTSDWTTGLVYERDWFTKYLFLLKNSNGQVRIRKINGDGTVGESVAFYDWSAGWTTASVMDNRFLFLLKQTGSASTI